MWPRLHETDYVFKDGLDSCTSLVLELQACVTTPGLCSTGALTQDLLHTRHGLYH